MRSRLKNELPTVQVMHVYEVCPRKDKRGVDLISDALPLGRLWYGEPNAVSNAINAAKFRNRSHRGVIRVDDEAGNMINENCAELFGSISPLNEFGITVPTWTVCAVKPEHPEASALEGGI